MDSSRLRIKKLAAVDLAEYICRVTNNFGSSLAGIRLNEKNIKEVDFEITNSQRKVSVEPPNMQIIILRSLIYPRKGDDFDILCIDNSEKNYLAFKNKNF